MKYLFEDYEIFVMIIIIFFDAFIQNKINYFYHVEKLRKRLL